MITIDCRDVVQIQNELLVYVADKLEAIPTLKRHQFTLSTLDDNDDSILNTHDAVSAIKEYLDSIHQTNNFAVVADDNLVRITSFSGKTLEHTGEGNAASEDVMFSCTHCGFITRYQTELNVHMRIHYI